jgi:hypothetical protein
VRDAECPAKRWACGLPSDAGQIAHVRRSCLASAERGQRLKICLHRSTRGGLARATKIVRLVLAIACVPTIGRAQTPALLLFGGDDHEVFLGCANCLKTEPTSICNQFGQFGSQFQSDSIWNMFGAYGSKFNIDSPWNQFSRGSVAIVDNDGNFYGHLTANKYENKRTTIVSLN